MNDDCRGAQEAGIENTSDFQCSLHSLKQTFPQIDEAILSETLKDEGSFQAAMESLVKSLEGTDIHTQQIENDEQIARALQTNQNWALQTDQWLDLQGEAWENVKRLASNVSGYVSEGYASLTSSIQQYINDDDTEGSAMPEHVGSGQNTEPTRETKKER